MIFNVDIKRFDYLMKLKAWIPCFVLKCATEKLSEEKNLKTLYIIVE